MSAARQQAEPQRLLFVFLKVSLPEDFKDDQETSFHSGEGGELQPIMCADKVLEELGTFADLVAESEKIEQGWQMVLIACLSGRNGIAPNHEEAEKPLKMMLEAVETGGDLSKYMAFDREGNPIQFG